MSEPTIASQKKGTEPAWRSIGIGQLAEIIFDGPFGSNLKSDDYASEGARVVRLENIEHLRFVGEKQTFITLEKYERLKKHTLHAEDVLFSSFVDEEIRVCLFPRGHKVPAINKADCFCIRVDRGLCDPQWLAFRLASNSTYQELREAVHGATRPRINLSVLKSLQVELPPLREQQRMVVKIDSLSGGSKRARDHLDHIPLLVKKYKQAILAAALRGDLTASWREANAKVQWLAKDRQLLSERHAEYMRRRKGSRLRELDQSLFQANLPSSWLRGHLADAVELLAGFAFKSEWYQSNGVRLLRGVNVAPGKLDWVNAVGIADARAREFAEYRVIVGDIVVAMDRPVISGGFKISKVTSEDAGALLVQRVSRIRPIAQLAAEYIWYYMNSAMFIDHAMATATGSDLPHISANDILSAPIYLPPPEEQIQIVKHVHSALSWLERIVIEHTSASRLLPRLDQSILAKAFRGELVPQNPSDESASALLDRIKAERSVGATSTRVRKGGKSRS